MHVLGDSAFKKTTLDSGITVITENLPQYRTLALGIWIKSGSRNETQTNKGIAHFIEHMLFKGTENRSALEIARTLENLGSNLNAYTSKEETCLYIQTLEEHLEISVDVLADMVCNSTFKTGDISKEKQIVLEEILSVKDTPEEYIYDVFQEKVFPDDPLGFPILGYPQTVMKFSKKSILDFWNYNYIPNNLIIAAAGKVEHEKLVKLIKEKIKIDRSYSELKNQVKPDAAKNVRVSFNESLNQSHICTGGEGISYRDQARFDFIALNIYLGGGMSSRLFQILREKYGYVYSVYSFIDFYRDIGIWGIYAGTDKKNEQRTIDIIKEEFMRLNKKPLPKKTVQELKEQIKGNLLISLESSFKRMTRIAKNEMYFQKYISIDELIKKIETITPSSLYETTQKYMNPDQFNTVTISPLIAA